MGSRCHADPRSEGRVRRLTVKASSDTPTGMDNFGSETTEALDLLRKSGEFPVSNEELDDAATTVYEGI